MIPVKNVFAKKNEKKLLLLEKNLKMISVITRNAFQSRPLSFGLSHSLSLFGPGVKENGLFYRFNSDLGIVTIRVPYVTII